MRLHQILVVEDQPFQREYLLELFREEGTVELHVAEDGNDALRQLELGSFDLVVSDLMMPGLDGVQFIQQLANHVEPPPLVIMSSVSPQLMDSACLAARAHGITVLEQITKPVKAHGVRRLLDKLILHRQRSEAPGSTKSSSPLTSVSSLEKALASGEFKAWFQPKYSLADGRIVAAEALVRWLHPQHGVLRPSSFMDAISAANMDEALFWEILRQAIEAQREWAQQGARVKVAVNLPTHLLENRNLPDEMAGFVARHGGTPANTVFELLESTTAQAADYYAATCRLRMMGFGLAQDDFGQGYSSLYNLVSTPFTELKIDRTLVGGCMDDERLAAALESMIKLGHQLGLEVVAEGVEHADELDFLRRLNCDLAQGYLISEAVAPAAFSRML
ncbi:EAL domain-containing response regulator [Pseudomonas sp. EggHat1]|uniref:EAL domain-containing response regulator n=1 Tax=Pseudomonas sp. EggHat1 TaxID=2761624 RepID=UPI001869453B|nr:EAL domain-containing response regulator [Pseudomonas sp. EggHat1]